jgi:phosphatidylserine decarboxylase
MSEPKESAALRFLYHTPPGRLLLRGLTRPWLSRLAGRFLDSRASRRMIPGFVRRNGIVLDDYLPEDYGSFNEFFTRRIRPERRPIAPEGLIAPCDGLLSAYRITEDARFAIKNSTYSVEELLGDDPIAARYAGGYCLVFRLCVTHYHRYCYLDDGTKGENVFLPGRLHTVRPIALAAVPVFVQNSREYTILQTAHLGMVTQVEVGALMVGKIQNHHGAYAVTRGEEKGMFRYGGSTIVVLLEPNAPPPNVKYFDGQEHPVQMGQPLT